MADNVYRVLVVSSAFYDKNITVYVEPVGLPVSVLLGAPVDI